MTADIDPGSKAEEAGAGDPDEHPRMTSACDVLADDLRGAFRRFYVWRNAQGGWRARPLPKLTPEEIAFGIQQELVAETRLELAFACTWQRSRRNVHRYLQEHALERPRFGS